MDCDDPVRAYYAQFDQHEWHRWSGGQGLVEFANTTHWPSVHFPDPGRVVDDDASSFRCE